MQDIFPDDVEPGGQPAYKRVEGAAQRREFPRTQEFVQDQERSAGLQYAYRLRQAKGGVRDDRDDQVHQRDIEGSVSKRQLHGVPLDQDQGRASRWNSPQHGTREVDAHVFIVFRKVGYIQARAYARDEYSVQAGAGNTRQAATPNRGRSAAQQRIVRGGEERIAVFEAQCRTRGTERVNSGIGASKAVPSSATIW